MDFSISDKIGTISDDQISIKENLDHKFLKVVVTKKNFSNFDFKASLSSNKLLF